MKTKRKLHTRLLALSYAVPLHPVSYERGKAMFAQIKAKLKLTIT